MRALYPCLLAFMCATGAADAVGQIAISNTQLLSFGNFVAGTGSITLSPAGSRVASGSVVVLDSGPGQAASFTVIGDPNTAFSVSLPADGTVVLSNGSSSMPVNGFVSSPGGSGVLSGGGTQNLSVGARLHATDGQALGAYSGSFMVVVNYN